VTTAAPLSDDQRRRIADVLRERTGREVAVTERVDDSLLGGLVVEIGDELIDGSVSWRLKRLRSALLEHGQQEMTQLRKAAIEA
jgi:F-type H+-transporting ATPase subunit delta